MATLHERARPGALTADSSQPYLALRIDYRFAVGLDAKAPDVIADILSRPCFAPVELTALETDDGSQSHRHERAATAMATYLRDKDCAVLSCRSDHESELEAVINIETGRYREGLQTYPAPLVAQIILPHEPEQLAARIQAFCELGTVLQAIFGCVSLEPSFEAASRLSTGVPPRGPLQQAVKQPGMSERRFRERHGPSEFPEKIGRRIPGPEWAIFLSSEHLAQLSAEVLQPGGVFSQVERLADGLVYAQLTDDPADALRAGYDSHLDRARDALAPILMDVSGIELG